MKTILHTVHIHAAPRQVYEALTTADALSKWWTTKVTVEEGTGGLIRLAPPQNLWVSSSLMNSKAF